MSALVPRVRVAPDGPELSRLAYGTWKIFDDKTTATPQHLARRLETCRDLGITTIDTAEIYGGYEVEELLGQALALSPGLRARLEIVTKCGIYVPHPRHPERKVPFYNVSAAKIVSSVEKSLRLLKVDHLDVLLVHRPDWLTAAEDTAAGLAKVLEQGKVRHVGVSNYNVHQLEALNAFLPRPVITNQIELSLFRPDPIFDGTLDQCQRLRICPMAWSPLGRGRLFSEDDEAAERIQGTVAGFGEKYGGAGLTELALAWVLAHPSRPIAVFGTNKLERLATMARGAQVSLGREDWYALWQAAAGRRIP